MKRLVLFLVGAYAFFLATFAISDPNQFFGRAASLPGQPVTGAAVERALAVLDAAMVRYYETGDEGPALTALAEPARNDSPLALWRIDRALYLTQGRPPGMTLAERSLTEIAPHANQEVTVVARERWVRAGDVAVDAGTVVVRYLLVSSAGDLRVADVQVDP